ncbi:hypothetical protein [Fluviispira sanaruensis]|uniref:Uncharacterized protein n=1 Tax=Fluviispira sanaruensis TaxID=2493639 RepID=A0A4P2VLR7_FLUSA|nr:hypothetical protein [Fluviispira sanaruensis]BBH53831.1 hypothetical protein JCM31447_22830 [Fluviispira sanaruensis]
MPIPIKNKLLSAFIGLIFITVFFSTNHHLFIYLNGAIFCTFLLIIFFILHKFQFHYLSFISYHFTAIALFFIYPLAEIAVFSVLAILLREFILLTKERGEKNSRTSLLWDLGAIKPNRQILIVLYHTLPLIITSLVIGIAANMISFSALALAYIPLFIFAISFGNLLFVEMEKAELEKR